MGKVSALKSGQLGLPDSKKRRSLNLRQIPGSDQFDKEYTQPSLDGMQPGILDAQVRENVAAAFREFDFLRH
jgi:hypothetical protein